MLRFTQIISVLVFTGVYPSCTDGHRLEEKVIPPSQHLASAWQVPCEKYVITRRKWQCCSARPGTTMGIVYIYRVHIMLAASHSSACREALYPTWHSEQGGCAWQLAKSKFAPNRLSVQEVRTK
ncbi:hypothetical protein BJY52DRAFT_164865 [Lactarius psammicola]|nr:hypothetical protein BJY52DRAFT_164865 [Lactarius psammicola]